MTTPVKNAAISLGIHIVSLLLMLVVFKWNIYAIVAGNIVFSLSMCILNAKAIYKYSGYVQEKKNTFIKPLIASGIMGAVTFVFHKLFDLIIGGRIATVLALLVAVAVYAVCVLKIGAFTEEELLAMPKGSSIVNLAKKFRLI